MRPFFGSSVGTCTFNMHESQASSACGSVARLKRQWDSITVATEDPSPHWQFRTYAGRTQGTVTSCTRKRCWACFDRICTISIVPHTHAMGAHFANASRTHIIPHVQLVARAVCQHSPAEAALSSNRVSTSGRAFTVRTTQELMVIHVHAAGSYQCATRANVKMHERVSFAT
jgi:hypothetical protein